MKIIPIDIIKSMSGKVCQHSDTYISLNGSSGKMHTGKRCHPYTGPATDKQIAQQQAFKARSEKATAWLLANRPSATNGPKGTAAYQLAESIKKALQLSNVRQVICRYMDDSGKVTLPNINANPNTNPNSGGAGGGGEIDSDL